MGFYFIYPFFELVETGVEVLGIGLEVSEIGFEFIHPFF
jgi:hypothetical protein